MSIMLCHEDVAHELNFIKNLIYVHLCFNIYLAVRVNMTVRFLDTTSVNPLLTSQVFQNLVINRPTACRSLSWRRRQAGSWEGWRLLSGIDSLCWQGCQHKGILVQTTE